MPRRSYLRLLKLDKIISFPELYFQDCLEGLSEDNQVLILAHTKTFLTCFRECYSDYARPWTTRFIHFAVADPEIGGDIRKLYVLHQTQLAKNLPLDPDRLEDLFQVLVLKALANITPPFILDKSLFESMVCPFSRVAYSLYIFLIFSYNWIVHILEKGHRYIHALDGSEHSLYHAHAIED
jgi:hypothetical protein